MDGCHISLVFPTDFCYLHLFFSLLCLDKKVIYSYLCSPILLLVFCYSFSTRHSNYFTALLEAHQRFPNAPWDKSHNSQHSSGSCRICSCLPLWLHLTPVPPLFTPLGLHAPSLCLLDKPSPSCFWPFVLTVLTSSTSSHGCLILPSSQWDFPWPSSLRKAFFSYRFSHLPDHILYNNNTHI